MSPKTVMDRMTWTTTGALTAVALLVAPSGSRGAPWREVGTDG
jgi:hypothetical protein